MAKHDLFLDLILVLLFLHALEIAQRRCLVLTLVTILEKYLSLIVALHIVQNMVIRGYETFLDQ